MGRAVPEAIPARQAVANNVGKILLYANTIICPSIYSARQQSVTMLFDGVTGSLFFKSVCLGPYSDWS